MTTHPVYLATYGIEEGYPFDETHEEYMAWEPFYRTQPRPRPEPRLSIREALGEENEADLDIEYLMEGVEDAGSIDR